MFEKARLSVRTGKEVFETPVSTEGTHHCGPLEIEIEEFDRRLAWSATSSSNSPVEVDAISLIWEAEAAGKDVRVFCNGYQSWSRACAQVLGSIEDPSRASGSIDLVRALYHADPGVAREGELRSEMVAVIDRGAGPMLGFGFEGAKDHDSTFRFRRVDSTIEIEAEAFLGGARVVPGAFRVLHPVVVSEGDSPPELLELWAETAGRSAGALTGAPYQTGWCSWYHYFHEISKKEVLKNLSHCKDWPIETFQIDDGYQSEVGDWLVTNDRFEGGLADLAAEIARSGRQPGIWIAPFLVSPDSELAKIHPEMLAGTMGGGMPLVGMVNPGWGGLTYVLDVTADETQDHLERLASDLVALGFTYLKLDFSYAPSIAGRYADPSLTPAQRVRVGLEAIRRGAGIEAFLLGCGCPLGPAIGIVDGMRIGPDVAPSWKVPPDQFVPPGYEQEAPATLNAWRNTLTRSFMHRKLWLNDPDCMMLRTSNTQLSPDAAQAWALAVAASGGMALISDDLSILDRKAKALFEEVISIGREVDAAAVRGSPPRCEDLMEREVPRQLSAGKVRLIGDTDGPSARLESIS